MVEGPELPLDERLFVLLADFENNTDEENLGASIRLAARAILDQSTSSTILSARQVRDALQRMQLAPETEVSRPLAAEIARREGAERVIVGSISKFGSTYSVVFEVVEPLEDRTVFSYSERSSDSQDLLADVEKGVLRIRAHLGDSAIEIDRAEPLANVATPNMEALKAYTVGNQKFETFDTRGAVKFLSRSIELDPEFAMAHAKLGVIYGNSGDLEKGLEHLEAAARWPDRLSDSERFYVNGWLARWKGSPDDVIENWTLMSELHPESYAAAYNLGVSLWTFRNDFSGARQAFDRAVGLSRGAFRDSCLGYLGQIHVALNRFEDAELAFDKISDDSETGGLGRVLLALARGQEAEPGELSKVALQLGRSRYTLFLALLAVNEGNVEGGLELIETVLKQNDLVPSTRMQALADKAAILDFLGKKDEFYQTIHEAVIEGQKLLDPPTVEFQIGTVPLLAVFGKMLARRNDVEMAQGLLQRIEPIASKTRSEFWLLQVKMLEAELLSSQGRNAEALKALDSVLGSTSTSFQSIESLAYIRNGGPEGTGLRLELRKHRGLLFAEFGSQSYGQVCSLLLAKQHL